KMSILRKLQFISRLSQISSCKVAHIPQCCSSSITGHEKADKALETVTGGRIFSWLQVYEDVVGLTEVREAQEKVIKAEHQFLDVQEIRREKQKLMTEIHAELKNIASELDKVQRGDDRYLKLLTEEHTIIKKENELKEDIKVYEKQELHSFTALSNAVRESHEKERSRTERTKYWSVIGSIIGAAIGITGTSINNYLRMRELRGMIKESTAGGVDLKNIVAQLSDTMKNQHHQITGFVGDLKSLLLTDLSAKIEDLPQIDTAEQTIKIDTKKLLDTVGRNNEEIANEMKDIKKLVAMHSAEQSENNVIYIGPEVEGLLKNTESNLEWKMKMNSLWTATFLYGAFALTLPVLYQIFKGGS
ncbi:unnamed protein product, partial [Owenia fusiformis]